MIQIVHFKINNMKTIQESKKGFKKILEIDKLISDFDTMMISFKNSEKLNKKFKSK